MVDPQDIERVQFKATRLKEGYDQDEVDNYLDRVANSLRSVLASNGELEAENVRLKRQLAEANRRLESAADAPTQALPLVSAEPTAAAARLLELAQKTADDVVAQAQQNAVDITARADANAHDIVNAATNEADSRRRKAEAEAYRAQEVLDGVRELKETTRAHLVGQLEDLKNRLGE
jgi:DivIVA domain-containing protein